MDLLKHFYFNQVDDSPMRVFVFMRRQKLKIWCNKIFMLSPSVFISFTLCSLPSEAVLQWETVEEPIPLSVQILSMLKYA